MEPRFLIPGVLQPFPDPRAADAEGLVAIGGDLSVERLLLAYGHGVFPWYDEESPILWWSPDPRAVIVPARLHISRRMERVRRDPAFRISCNQAFSRVMVACAQDRDDGTWILPEMVEAYTALHEQGHAHSIEVWVGDDLVGGLYGVQRGGLFAGESMFHTVSNASKLALIEVVERFAAAGGEVVDVQMMTDHLRSMGAELLPRSAYLDWVGRIRDKPVTLSA